DGNASSFRRRGSGRRVVCLHSHCWTLAFYPCASCLNCHGEGGLCLRQVTLISLISFRFYRASPCPCPWWRPSVQTGLDGPFELVKVLGTLSLSGLELKSTRFVCASVRPPSCFAG